MNNKNSRAHPRARHKVTRSEVNARPPARVTPPRGTPARGTPPPAAVTRTRLIRFRLNPRSDGDQQILSWLAQVAPYYRADAIRTALLTHILRRHGGGDLPPVAATGANAVVPPAASTAARKLEKMFSA
jgi:hypothetical protein